MKMQENNTDFLVFFLIFFLICILKWVVSASTPYIIQVHMKSKGMESGSTL